MRKYFYTSQVFLFFLLFTSPWNEGYAQDSFWAVENLAGDGTTEFTAGEPLETGFWSPGSVVEDSENNIYFTVSELDFVGATYGAILKIDAVTGLISEHHYIGEFPSGLTIDNEDNLYYSQSSLADDDSRQIWKLPADGGAAVPFAGTGVEPAIYSGPGDKDAVNIGSPTNLIFDPAGENLYFWDYGYNSIFKINMESGAYSLVAGTPGMVGSTSDEIPNGTDAEDVVLLGNLGLVISADNTVYFNNGNSTTYLIDDENKIQKVAGTSGTFDFGGDGGLATDAILSSPQGLLIYEDNTLLIADNGNRRIREVNLTTGVINTFAGTGIAEGDGGNPDGDLPNGEFNPALETNIQPLDIKNTSKGIVISDTKENRIRRMAKCVNPEVTFVSLDFEGLCKGDEIELVAAGNINDADEWRWIKGSCDLDAEPVGTGLTVTVEVDETATYHFIGAGGCVSDEECEVVTVTVNCREFFNVITPNGDGINDFFEAPVLENFPENTVSFYNRWGDLLEEVENYDNVTNVWAGTNGVDEDGGEDGDDNVNSGTYFFTAVSNGEVIVSGWIEVIR